MFQGKLAVVPFTIYLQCKMWKLINVWVLRSSRRQSFQYFLLVKPLLPISRCLNTISRVQQYSYAWHKVSFHMYNEVTITLQLCSCASNKDKCLKGISWGKTQAIFEIRYICWTLCFKDYVHSKTHPSQTEVSFLVWPMAKTTLET